jgi:beta-lactamase superfamily II metal-dependent hydrolase
LTPRKALIDFRTPDDVCKLEKLVRGAVEGEREQTMLELEYAGVPWKSFREGNWYDLSERRLANWEYVPIGRDEPGATVLRGRILDRGGPLNASAARRPFAQAALPNVRRINLEREPDGLTLEVVDCGQGNWNEITSEASRLIYDVGASLRHTPSDIRKLVLSRGLSTERRPTTLVISHWDTDHYQAILEATNRDLRPIRQAFVPSQTPATATFARVQARLASNNVRLQALPPAPRPPGSGRRIVLVPMQTIGPYRIYRAVDGASRNQTGIVMTASGESRTAILTGDHHYPKILAAIATQNLRQSGVLVTPHHGGHAGQINARAWMAQFPQGLETPISVGANSYGHPFEAVEGELTLLQGGRPPPRTDARGTMPFSL